VTTVPRPDIEKKYLDRHRERLSLPAPVAEHVLVHRFHQIIDAFLHFASPFNACSASP